MGRADVLTLPDRLAQDLRRRLSAGEWTPGQAIPAETSLAGTYEVSRNTIREAISRLVTEGLLRIQRGVGTIVSPPPPPPASMMSIAPFRMKRSLPPPPVISPANLPLSMNRSSPAPKYMSP